jgi:hypothetical protein
MKKHLTIFFSLLLLMSSCKKDSASSEIQLSYQMIAEKVWYLDYAQNISSNGLTTKSYIGQSTYFVQFLKDNTTFDSDGIKGTYTVEKQNGILQIHVQAKTTASNSIEYIYNVETLAANIMILSFQKAGVTTKLYYNTSH